MSSTISMSTLSLFGVELVPSGFPSDSGVVIDADDTPDIRGGTAVIPLDVGTLSWSAPSRKPVV